MNLPPGYTGRPATLGDLDAVVQLFDRWSLAVHGETEPVKEFITSVWRSPWIDLDRDTLLVHDPEGELVAYGESSAIDPQDHVEAFVCSDPAHVSAGLGEAVHGWTVETARARVVPGTTSKLRPGASSLDAHRIRILEGDGYTHVRTIWNMRRGLEPDMDPGPPPAGVVIRASVEEQDDRGIYETDDEAFASHFGYQRVSFEDWWREERDSGLYSPDLILVAEADGRIVGLSLQVPTGDVGWVGVLAVRPSWQGQGVGRALLRHAFADLARRGFREVRLNVDSENESGATRLYESAGMAVIREWRVYEKPVPAG